MKVNHRNARGYTGILIISTALVRMILASVTGLGTGESYYYRGAKVLNLSYFDQPPLFLWLSGASIRLFGESTFALRLPTILLFAGTTWLLFIITKRFFNARAGFYAAVVLNMSAVFTVSVGMWFQPDSPLMFFWLLTTYCIVQVLFPVKKIVDNKRFRNTSYAYIWWGLIGLSMGLTTLSKYHIVFLLAGVFLFALFNKEQRHWIWHPGPYIALVLNFAVALPVFIWNADNNWVSFVFQASRAGKNETTLHVDWLLRSIGGQAMWLLPWVWIPLIVQLFRLGKALKFNETNAFFFWTSVLPIVFFTLVTLWSDLQFHFHWQAPGYLMLMMPLGAAVDRSLQETGKYRGLTKRWLYSSSVFTLISFSLLMGHMVTGFWSVGGPKDFAAKFGEKKDPTIDGCDYDAIRDLFEEKGWMQDENIFVASPKWWIAGKTDWALRGKKEVVVLHYDPRNYAFLVDPKNSLGKDAVIIGDITHEAIVNNEMKPFFDQIVPLDPIWVERAGKKEYELQVFYAKNFRVPTDTLRDYNYIPVYRQLLDKPPFMTE